MKSKNINQLVLAGVLCGIGIVVPMLMPKIVIGPMSFTLASHVAIFIAMFISPKLAAVVCLGTTLGFFMTTPVIIALRAASHICFALLGAVLIRKIPEIIEKPLPSTVFNGGLAFVHALAEVAVVFTFLSGRQHFQTGTACRRLCYERTCSGRGWYIFTFADRLYCFDHAVEACTCCIAFAGRAA